MKLWVIDQIYRHSEMKEQMKIFQHFIQIAFECSKLQSYNATNEIISALNDEFASTGPHFKNLTPKVQITFLELTQLTTHLTLEYMKNQSSPVLPTLDSLLHHLEILDQSYPDKIGDLWNYEKLTRLAEAIESIQFYQGSVYDLLQVPSIQSWILAPQVRQSTKSANKVLTV
jgi:hypothetical protein